MNGMDRRTGARLEGVDHLRQSIEDVLSTPIGTRCCRRDYGSLIPELLDQPNNALGRMRIFAAAAHALLRQEERCRLEQLTLEPGETPQSAVLRLRGRRTDGARSPFDFPVTVRARSATLV